MSSSWAGRATTRVCRADHLAPRQRHRRRDHLVQVDRLERSIALHHQPPQLHDDPRRATIVVGDVAEYRRQLGQVRRVLAEHLRTRLGIGENGGERLVQFVRQRPGQSAKLRGTRQVRELEPLGRQFVGHSSASPLLHQERDDGGALQPDDSHSQQDLPPVALPSRGLVEEPLRARRQQPRVDPEAADLPPVDDGLRHCLDERGSGDAGRRLDSHLRHLFDRSTERSPRIRRPRLRR